MSWQPQTLSKAQREERRLEGGRLLREGKLTQREIADHLGVSPASVCKWKQKLDAHNRRLTALASTTAQGANPRLTAKQWKQIKRMILAGALAAGFSTERWTLSRIQQAIKTKFGVSYTTAWLSIRLRQLGLSVQRPQTKARQRDDELAEAWLKQDWPRIKKSVRTSRSHHLR